MMDADELKARLAQFGSHLDAERSARHGRPPQPPEERGGPTTRLPGGAAFRVSAVAISALAVVGLAVFVTRGDGSTKLLTDPSASTSTDADTSTTTTVENQPAPGPTGGQIEFDGGLDLPGLAASLPSGVDLNGGSMIWVGPYGSNAEEVARGYLDDRLPDLRYQLTEMETLDELTRFRWLIDDSDLLTHGSVVVRIGGYLPGVVLATTDRIEIISAERTMDRIAVEVEHTMNDLLVADVTSVLGDVVPAAPRPEGFNDGDEPIFGTAGSSSDDRLELDVAVSPDPAVVRIQNVGGTMLSIVEFALDAVGFADSCGTDPPVSIDVGDLLDDLTDGPTELSARNQLINQRIWHHQGETAAIEIRWPADPVLSSRLPPEQYEESTALSFQRLDSPNRPGHVLNVIGPSTGDPCGIVQISVYGDSGAVEWWTTAISGQLSFGLPLTVAELDPAVGPDGEGDAGQASTGELVLGTESASELPTVPKTGSCDGDPDAPPRTGVGDGVAHESPDEALVRFLASSSEDPPLPDQGYTERVIDETRVVYWIPGRGGALIVIELVGSDSGWTVERWSAAVC